MEVKEQHSMFPKTALVFDDQKLKKNINVNAVIRDIDFVIQNKIHVADPEHHPGIQTSPVFWRKDIKWWEDEYNSDWDQIKESFKMCCQKYIQYMSPNNSGYNYPTQMKAWAFKGITQFGENHIHNHFPATLSGILYLKNKSNVGTEFYDFSGMVQKYTVNVEEMDWLIFPSILCHRPESINEIDRYTLACDFYVGTY
jgi:hypothetical protein